MAALGDHDIIACIHSDHSCQRDGTLAKYGTLATTSQQRTSPEDSSI
jgi:hypothetical protein